MYKIIAQILGLPIVVFLTLIKPKDKIRHQYTVYGTFFGLMYGYNFNAINFILNQVNLESNYGKSTLSKTINNVIGMRCVSKRPTTQSGCFTTTTNGSFGMYTSIIACIQDRYLWGKSFREEGKNPYQMEQLASQFYCSSDPDYVKKINALPDVKWCIWLILLAVPVTIITPILIFKKIKL